MMQFIKRLIIAYCLQLSTHGNTAVIATTTAVSNIGFAAGQNCTSKSQLQDGLCNTNNYSSQAQLERLKQCATENSKLRAFTNQNEPLNLTATTFNMCVSLLNITIVNSTINLLLNIQQQPARTGLTSSRTGFEENRLYSQPLFCGAKRLRFINISNSDIPSLGWRLMSSESRPVINLTGNTFNCSDCSSQWLREFEKLSQLTILEVPGSSACNSSGQVTESAAAAMSTTENIGDDVENIRLNYSAASFYGLPKDVIGLTTAEKEACVAKNRTLHSLSLPQQSRLGYNARCALPQLSMIPLVLLANEGETVHFKCRLNQTMKTRPGKDKEAFERMQLQRYTALKRDLLISQNTAHIAENEKELSIANVTANDTGWIFCTTRTGSGPAVAMSILLVRTAPHIEVLSQDFSINSSYFVYVEFAIRSYVKPCLRINKQGQELSLGGSGYNDVTKIMWSDKEPQSPPPSTPTVLCSAVGENTAPLQLKVDKIPFVYHGYIQFDSIAARTDIHDEFTLVACNEKGCHSSGFKIRTQSLNANNSPHSSKTEDSGTVVTVISVVATILTVTILLLLSCAVFAYKRRQLIKAHQKRTSIHAQNDTYHGILGHRGSEGSSTVPFIPLHLLGADGSTRPSRSASLVTYLTSLWGSRRTSQQQQTPLFLEESRLKWDRKIGEGYFSEVYLAYCTKVPGEKQDAKEPLALAIKVVKDQNVQTVQTIYCEAELNMQLKHANIIRFFGLAIRTERNYGRLCLAFEFMPCGDLKNYLRKHGPLARLLLDEEFDSAFESQSNSTKQQLQSSDLEDSVFSDQDQDPYNLSQIYRRKRTVDRKHLTHAELLHIACQTASGLAYLESRKFIHRDIAARNCLVGELLTVKISDFGMSKDVYDMEYYKTDGRKLLPVRWLPPESFQLGTFNSKTDIWSYGVLLWEIFAYGRQPWTKLTNAEVIDAVLEGKILEQPEQSPQEIYDLMRNCWRQDPNERVTAAQMEKALDALRNSNTTSTNNNIGIASESQETEGNNELETTRKQQEMPLQEQTYVVIERANFSSSESLSDNINDVHTSLLIDEVSND